ncbi:glycosyltransferase family 1 protein [Algoriphagus kandeliae]|uniref:Glycosyltransferase family 1 protein n=1 Tax=Algoriphagus kandeliae TaxID=2562278 RepID=A0A4Y9R2E9_9BACT|nr:glycosyltransferase family 4 protein [Algoriphagus kandeliae]TFV97415.1 glycosyltransferase family 1 protein [Algoriphagus kandeliae]
MKILFILHFPPPIHGAAMVGQYIKSSTLINQSLQAYYINLSTSNSVDDIGKSGLKKWVRYFKIIFQTVFRVLFHRPDMVYITLTSSGLGFLKDSVIVGTCRLFRVPHVFHFHNKGVKEYSQSPIGKRLYPFVFKKAHVILLSPLLYSDVEDFVPMSRVYFCPNGIPDLGFSESHHKEVEKKLIHILFLSNLIKSKGVLDLLKACEILKNKGLNFKCTLAGGEGDISVEELNKQINQLNLRDRVQFIGKVFGEEKIRILQKADVFIHPTHEDCFPLVLLEAMQAGLPIVSTKEGAIPEIIEEGVNGLLVPAQSPKELAKTILTLCENPELRQGIGNAGRKKFQREYSLETFENSFLNVLSEIGTKLSKS